MPDTAQTGRYLCYEGFPLESVLARVTSDHGAAATITSAERVRRGGVKGFFAREVFQVIVDLGDGADASAVRPERLFASADGAKQRATNARATSQAGGTGGFDTSEIDPEDIDGALALDFTLGRAERTVEDPLEDHEMSFERSFGEDAELWALLASGAAASDATMTPPVFIEPNVVAHTPVAAAPAEAVPSTATPSIAASAPVNDSFVEATLVSALSSSTPGGAPAVSSGRSDLLAAAPPAPVWSSPVRDDLPFVTETVPHEAIAAELVQPLRSLGPIASTTVIPASTQAPGSVFGTPFDPFRRPHVPQSDEVANHVAQAVVPSQFGSLDPVKASRLGDMLSSLDASLPTVPAVPDHGVIVMVGERADTIAAANQLAARLGLGPDAVLVASPAEGAPLPSNEELAALAQTAASKATPRCVVVVELLAGRSGHEWTRAVSMGIAAMQVRFVADARRYVSHQHLSIAAIGGVDVVDLVGMDEIIEPTAALAVGVPIGSLDGRPASTELWAATLMANRAAVVDSISQPGADWFGAEGE